MGALPHRPARPWPATGPGPSDIVAVSQVMRDLVQAATRAAASDAKVLVTGESGVGKEVLANHIHVNSRRRDRPLVAINCAGVAESLLESELFGHVKGSFTGAYRDNPGRLQQADGGTLFLDEVGEMSLRMQALLLRFLENGEIQPVGADRWQGRVDVRLIAATNRNLEEMVNSGGFRQDLLYRLRVIHLHLPPLRDRREDIPQLVQHLMRRLGRDTEFSEAALDALMRYRWPGNVRELANVIEQACWMLHGATVVELEHLPPSLREDRRAAVPARERRRQLADELYDAIVAGQASFWDHVYPLFLARDLTRHDLRELVKRGLSETRGNYRALLHLFRIPTQDYKRFLNSLAAHGCSIDVRPYRRGTPPPRLARPPLDLTHLTPVPHGEGELVDREHGADAPHD